MNNKFFLVCFFPFALYAQVNNSNLHVLIANDYTLPLTISHLDAQDKEVKIVVGSYDTTLYKITSEQLLHLKPRFFELAGKAYQIRFSIPSAEKYKIEVWDVIKKAKEVKLGNKTHSLLINNQQTLYIHINKKGNLSLGVVEKKKLV